MRVCPQCGYADPLYWKHCKWSYFIDGCTRESFELLHPDLAKQLKKGGDLVEDDLYVYRLTKTELVVQRKAKMDFVDPSKFNDDGFEKGSRHEYANTRLEDFRPYWSKLHPSQTKLMEVTH